MDKDYILKVKGLYHQFLLGNNKTLQVLKNVSLSASRGEFISILGISGSGKSTLLKCISSLLEPTSGEVILNGINPYKIRNAKLSSIRRNEVSFIFQAYNLIPSLPVIENIALPLRLSQKKLTIKNVENLLKRMKFNAGLNDFVGTLSGGEQQKVAIARAVIADSDIIFADEPTGALDSVSREVIFELLRELVGAGKCVIMVTHDIELASKTDRALILKAGYVHGARLIFVEFFGKFYEGGGKPFQPLKASEKYIKVITKN